MSKLPRVETLEQSLLRDAHVAIGEIIARAKNKNHAKLSLLEEIACKHSGISISDYRKAVPSKRSPAFAQADIERLNSIIESVPLPLSLSLASLAREESSEVNTKQNGAVYTDFRLANYLASEIMSLYCQGPIIDTACGASIILAACAEEYCKIGGDSRWLVANNLYGVDLSSNAIRGSILALSVCLKDARDVQRLASHFLCADSLEIGKQIPKKFGLDSFAFVVGNPPWERVKPSRNEYARECGVEVPYGTELNVALDGYESKRESSRERSSLLAKNYGLKGGVDLYRAFLDLDISICSENGLVALYLPGGVIRSKSLWPVRKEMLEGFSSLRISLFMNQAKFFAIDSRFKFILCCLYGKGNGTGESLASFRFCSGNRERVTISSSLDLEDELFLDSSEELGVPEVRDEHEAEILRRIWRGSKRMSMHKLFYDACPVRELDMTLDKGIFTHRDEAMGDDLLPLIEGRMVSPYRCGCKEYVSGAGRSAKWSIVPLGISRMNPQYFVEENMLCDALRKRADAFRVGFCDIAGQTNERAMQAALVPARHVCGNKVPTMVFSSEDLALLWLGIANSFAFDWIIRRYITTTINFFILRNLPLPDIDENTAIAQEIIKLVREVISIDDGAEGWSDESAWKNALLRAKIDAAVLRAYGLDADDFYTIVGDFPLVDNANSKLSHGIRPTFELVKFELTGSVAHLDAAREAFAKGAIPFASNEYIRQLAKLEKQA